MSGFERMVGERKAGHILVLVKLFLLVLVIYFGVSTAKLWRAHPEGELPRQLSVSGEGKTTVKPDVAVFTATTVTQAPKVKDAQVQNTTRSNAMLDFVKKNPGKKIIVICGDRHVRGFNFYLKHPKLFEVKLAIYRRT